VDVDVDVDDAGRRVQVAHADAHADAHGGGPEVPGGSTQRPGAAAGTTVGAVPGLDAGPMTLLSASGVSRGGTWGTCVGGSGWRT
jgi:hypothetical protein